MLPEANEKTPTVYVCGPMRGYHLYNFPAFDDAAARLRSLGYVVISPADLDRAHGIDPTVDMDKVDALCQNADEVRNIIRRDVDAIMSLRSGYDFVVLLPGWADSVGAKAEISLAKWCGVNCIELRELVHIDKETEDAIYRRRRTA